MPYSIVNFGMLRSGNNHEIVKSIVIMVEIDMVNMELLFQIIPIAYSLKLGGVEFFVVKFYLVSMLRNSSGPTVFSIPSPNINHVLLKSRVFSFPDTT